MEYVRLFTDLTMSDVPLVGGKNASLGEMARELVPLGLKVAEGFATTADAYRDYLTHNGIAETVDETIAGLDVDDVEELARVGKTIREMIFAGEIQPQLASDIEECARSHDIKPSRRLRIVVGGAVVGDGRRFTGSVFCWPAGNLFECSWV
jgi:pyruvate, water dikinase